MKFKKYYIIEIIIIILFIIFLLSLIPSEKSNDKKENIIEIGTNSDKELKIKFNIITKEISNEFKTTKISQINNKYLSNLIVNQKISNRENTIAQEIISLYKKNLTQEAINLSKEIVDPILNKYDTEKSRKWINYDFKLKKENTSKNNTFHFYTYKPLLLNYSQSNIKSNHTIKIQPYLYERYNIILNNGSLKTIDINLITLKGEEKLYNYIDINTYKPKKNIKTINSTFIESENKYIFNFSIWK